VCSARIATNEGARRYERHQPENTLLYQIIDEYYPHFLAFMEQQGRSIPLYVQREFDDYLQCGRLEHGFLRVRWEGCHHERLVAFSGTKSRRPRRATRHLSQLWRQTDGRECRAAGR
jgi:hypothetical protein